MPNVVEVSLHGSAGGGDVGSLLLNARWYDPALGHFVQPDSIMPAAGNALDYHRCAYVRFNPLKYEDDSGHCAALANGQADLETDYDCWQLAYSIYDLRQGSFESRMTHPVQPTN